MAGSKSSGRKRKTKFAELLEEVTKSDYATPSEEKGKTHGGWHSRDDFTPLPNQKGREVRKPAQLSDNFYSHTWRVAPGAVPDWKSKTGFYFDQYDLMTLLKIPPEKWKMMVKNGLQVEDASRDLKVHICNVIDHLVSIEATHHAKRLAEQQGDGEGEIIGGISDWIPEWEAKRIKAIKDAQAAQLDIDMKTGKVYETKAALAEIAIALRSVKQYVKGMKNIAPELVGLDAMEIKKKLAEESDKACESIVEYFS